MLWSETGCNRSRTVLRRVISRSLQNGSVAAVDRVDLLSLGDSARPDRRLRCASTGAAIVCCRDLHGDEVSQPTCLLSATDQLDTYVAVAVLDGHGMLEQPTGIGDCVGLVEAHNRAVGGLVGVSVRTPWPHHAR
jgi:hypothetical protein